MRWTNRRFSPLSLKSSTNLSSPAIWTDFIVINDLDQSLENGGKLTPQPGMHTPIPEYSGVRKVEHSRPERPPAVPLVHPSFRQSTPAGRYPESRIQTTTATERAHPRTRAHPPLAREDLGESPHHAPKAWCPHTCRPSLPKP